jgi:nucleoside-diphosphate-sugar epimerase
MKILITGSEGNIARFFKADLVTDHELVFFDLCEAKTPLTTGQTFIQGDLMDPDACRRAVDGVQGIVHLAAVVHGYLPQAYHLNTLGTWNLLTAAAAAGVPRIAFSSTINVYGQGSYKIGKKLYDPPYLPIDENVPVRPEDPYGLSKLANEQAMQGFSNAYGISTYCFRLPAVWTPEVTRTYRPHPIHGQWTPHPARTIDPWNYIDARDVVSAMRRFLEMPTPPDFGIAYLVADDTSRDELTMDLLQQHIPHWVPLAGDRLPGHTAWFSNQRAKKDLGWAPQHLWRNRT